MLPAVHDLVLAKVTRLQARQVTVSICVVGETACADGFAGVVRREDVRGWEVDKVVVGEGFRVGDVLRGVVVSFDYPFPYPFYHLLLLLSFFVGQFRAFKQTWCPAFRASQP